jgi:hypothetical protein
MVEITLGQGDSDDIPVILIEDGIGCDLTGCVVKLLLGDMQGVGKYEITCTEGIRDSDGEIVTAFSEGGITVEILPDHTVDEGFLLGEFTATIGDRQVTFEKVDGNYLVMEVRKKFVIPV